MLSSTIHATSGDDDKTLIITTRQFPYFSTALIGPDGMFIKLANRLWSNEEAEASQVKWIEIFKTRGSRGAIQLASEIDLAICFAIDDDTDVNNDSDSYLMGAAMIPTWIDPQLVITTTFDKDRRDEFASTSTQWRIITGRFVCTSLYHRCSGNSGSTVIYYSLDLEENHRLSCLTVDLHLKSLAGSEQTLDYYKRVGAYLI